jgi:DNA-directed RNA polymerase specialized sigma24 family protein
MADHDDLVNETLLSVSQWITKNRNFPEGWVTGQVSKKERNSFYRLANVILRRRIADLYRLDTRDWGRLIRAEKPQMDDLPSRGASAEYRILLRHMLKITAGVLATLKPEDRDLIAIASIGSSGDRVLGARERQRLRRARKKIAKAIISELGDSVAELLSDE